MTGCSAAEDASRITEDFVLAMQIGNPVMTVNGAPHTLDTAPTIIHDRTMLPIRRPACGFVQGQAKVRLPIGLKPSCRLQATA